MGDRIGGSKAYYIYSFCVAKYINRFFECLIQMIGLSALQVQYIAVDYFFQHAFVGGCFGNGAFNLAHGEKLLLCNSLEFFLECSKARKTEDFAEACNAADTDTDPLAQRGNGKIRQVEIVLPNIITDDFLCFGKRCIVLVKEVEQVCNHDRLPFGTA